MFAAIRRRLAARKPFPGHWRKILSDDVPFYHQLSERNRVRLEEKLKIFALTKHFEGAGGMEVNERVEVVISACAARLTLNLPDEHYSRLRAIIVYPGAYHHPGRDDIVLGEMSGRGTMVLSWQAVVHGLKNTEDGLNTAFHEFAHALDLEDGMFDGTPILESLCAYAPWVKIMTHYYDDLRDGRRRKRMLRRYGATNEAEFFAVATEAFFEKPRQLRKRKRDLYDLLSDYYNSDPAAELEAFIERDRDAKVS